VKDSSAWEAAAAALADLQIESIAQLMISSQWAVEICAWDSARIG